jgi:hypothetical protein
MKDKDHETLATMMIFRHIVMYNMRAKLNYHDLDFDLATK